MRRVACLLIASTIGVALLSAAPGYSQYSQPPSPNSASERRKALEERQQQQRTKIERSNQKLESSIEATADQRRACTEEAKQQHLSLLKRLRFVKGCMAR